MAWLLERKLIFVTGKGGTGKSTIAAALGLLGARRGLRTLVVEVGNRDHLAALYDVAAQPGVEIELEPGLWSLSLDLDAALIEWMRELGGRLPARVLASSSSFQYFAAAAPGTRELVSLVKLHELTERDGDGRYELVVLDAPATGHALAMLASPRTFDGIVRGGPLARRAADVSELLADPRRTGYVAVARATEMAVAETLELEQGLRGHLQRDLDAIVLNGTMPRRFSAEELQQVEALARSSSEHSVDGSLALAAARAARAAHARSRVQRGQIARLRRERSGDGATPALANVPFAFVAQIDRGSLEAIARRLARGLRLD